MAIKFSDRVEKQRALLAGGKPTADKKPAKKPATDKVKEQRALLAGDIPMGTKEAVTKTVKDGLPAMIRQAAKKLEAATTAAEVLEAKEEASVAYEVARISARIAKAKEAHDKVVAAAHRAQADALEIEAAAKRRIADEYDAAQARGEIGKKGQRTDLVPQENKVATAEDVGLSRKEVMDARQIRDAIKQNPEIVREVLDDILEKGDEPTRAALKRQITPVVKAMRSVDKAKSRDKRLKMAAEAAAKGIVIEGQLPRAACPIIYADPAWENDVWGDETGHDKSPENHYPTMPLEDICALCAGDKSPATDDALLFLWRTGNRVTHGVDVARAWGFTPVAEIIWDKVYIGTGRWTRDRHEVLMICRRGKALPVPDNVLHSIQSEKKGDHSVKPVLFAQWITDSFPGVPKLEMFARREFLKLGDPRLDPENLWQFWGLDA